MSYPPVSYQGTRLCPNCGQPSANTGSFCTRCGSKLSEPTPPPSVSVQHVLQMQPVGFSCPFCRSTLPPQQLQRISTSGWIVFAMLLVFCFPLFWIGLLMKEPSPACSQCGVKLG